MMSFRSLLRPVRTASLAVGSLLTLASPTKAESITVVAAGNRLISFDSATPGTTSAPLGVTGLQPGETILGIDIRPATGDLYGLGSTSALYRISPTTGAAVLVGATGVALSGASFGFDFNPTSDRIRVTNDADQNFRLNPDTGASAAIDGNLNPGNPNVIGSAYTNNFSGALTTTLYDIDSVLHSLLIQSPPNNGTLVPVGPLGIDFFGFGGFDISGLTGTAYAALSPLPGPQVSQLYTINLATGAATLVGSIGAGNLTVTGLAAPIGAAASAPVPEPATFALMAAGIAAGVRRRRGSRRPR
jgi:hypothetical protein